MFYTNYCFKIIKMVYLLKIVFSKYLSINNIQYQLNK